MKFISHCLATLGAIVLILVGLSLLASWAQDHGYNPFM